MSWGAMMGLGQSLQQVGGMIGDYNKSKMRDRLEQEREQRQYERQLEKEARQEAQRLARPTEWKHKEVDGKWIQQAYNEDGTILTGVTRDMTPTEIEEFNRQRNAADRQDKIDTLKLGKAEFEAGNLEEAWRMRQEKHRADIDRNRASAEASRARANRSSSGGSTNDNVSPNQAQAAKLLTTEYKPLVDNYVGTAAKPGVLTRAEVEEIAMEAVRAAALQRKDATIMFRDELEKRAARKRDPKSINFR